MMHIFKERSNPWTACHDIDELRSRTLHLTKRVYVRSCLSLRHLHKIAIMPFHFIIKLSYCILHNLLIIKLLAHIIGTISFIHTSKVYIISLCIVFYYYQIWTIIYIWKWMKLKISVFFTNFHAKWFLKIFPFQLWIGKHKNNC